MGYVQESLAQLHALKARGPEAQPWYLYLRTSRETAGGNAIGLSYDSPAAASAKPRPRRLITGAVVVSIPSGVSLSKTRPVTARCSRCSSRSYNGSHHR